jgi:hypothetical protein
MLRCGSCGAGECYSVTLSVTVRATGMEVLFEGLLILRCLRRLDGTGRYRGQRPLA